MLATFAWQHCLLILGGICIINCFFGLLFKPLPAGKDEDSIGCEKLASSDSDCPDETGGQGDHKETFREMVRNPLFLMFRTEYCTEGYPAG